jgi:hypothetical protein
MKTIFTKFLAFSSLALLMLASCKKDETKVIATNGKSGALTASATTLVLDKTKLGDASAAISFNISKADFGYSAAITNTLQIDSLGDNWKKPYVFTLNAKTLSQSYNTADFNSMLLKLNLPADKASKIQVRVMHSLSSTTTPVYSNVLDLTVTPFNLTSYLYTVGAYQGWNIGNTDSLRSATSNGIYVGVLNFTAGNNEFLAVPGRHSYDNKYATNDPTGHTSSTIAVGGPNNLTAPAAAGFYTVTLDVNAKTIAFDPFTAYYSVIGDGAKGWDAGDDVDMQSANNGSGLWSVTVTLSSSGSIKIRKGHDWTTSYGVPKTGADGKTLTSSDNDNIAIPSSGTYKITFLPAADEKTAAYTMVKQ